MSSSVIGRLPVVGVVVGATLLGLATTMYCLAMHLGGAVMYYGDVLLELLPFKQKVSLVLTIGWLFAVRFRNRALKTVA